MVFKMLEVENDSKILDYKNKYDIPIWFFMRNFFFESLSSILYNDRPILVSRKNGFNALKYNLRALLFNFFHKYNKRSDVLFYTISREIKENGLYYNQYTDDYAELFSQNSISIQHPPLDWKWKFPRKNDNIVFNSPNLSYASIVAKIRKVNDDLVTQTYNYANSRAKMIFGVSFSDEEKSNIIRNTIYEMTRMHIHSKWMVKFCLKKRAKLVVMLGGSYSWYYEMVYNLKKHGIHVADLQHGIISSNNHVYNYSSSLLSNEYVKNGAPNYYLMYGKWWASQTNIPYDNKISIGNVFREKKIDKFIKKESDLIMLIGCNRKTNEYLELAQYVKNYFPTYKVIFRPHPTERYETKQLCSKHNYSVDIDYDTSLYDQLSRTKVLISEISTVLFEAIGLINNIIVWDTELSKYLSPESPFAKFETKEELLELLRKNVNYQIPTYNYDLWEKNALMNFKNLCKGEGIYDKS